MKGNSRVDCVYERRILVDQANIIQVPVDEELKKEVDKLFASLGYDTAVAIRMFLRRALQCRGIPFALNSRDLHMTN